LTCGWIKDHADQSSPNIVFDDQNRLIQFHTLFLQA
jgi:hypothetical protein